jgi:cytoskeletal protein CcmA (bactofilin family)
VIFFGDISEEPHTADNLWRVVNIVSTAKKTVRDIRFVDDDISENGVFDASIITEHSLTVLNDISVKGHIRSHKSVRLCDNSIVYGNIFAEGEIYIGRNVRIFGSVFTQENIHVERGTFIGQYGIYKSVIARKQIVFEKNCCVYGYVSTEEFGLSVPDESRKTSDIFDENKRRTEDQNYLNAVQTSYSVQQDNAISFPDPDHSATLTPFGFRKSELLTEVTIPEGVTLIHPSFFYECKNLKSVNLPATLETIGSFAFFGCTSLSDISFEKCTSLRSIGPSAFARCISLSSVQIPNSCSEIGSAAFSGSGLRQIDFTPPSSLSKLSDHVWKDCVFLKSLILPNSLKEIGTSALYGCSELTALQVPDSVERIKGYAFCQCNKLKKLVIPSRRLDLHPMALKGFSGKADIVYLRPGVQTATPVRDIDTKGGTNT